MQGDSVATTIFWNALLRPSCCRKRSCIDSKGARASLSFFPCFILSGVKSSKHSWVTDISWLEERYTTCSLRPSVPQCESTRVAVSPECWGHTWCVSRPTPACSLLKSFKAHITFFFCWPWQPRLSTICTSAYHCFAHRGSTGRAVFQRWKAGVAPSYRTFRLTFIHFTVNAWLVHYIPLAFVFCAHSAVLWTVSSYKRVFFFFFLVGAIAMHQQSLFYRCSKDVLPKPRWLMAYLIRGQHEVSCFRWQCTNGSSSSSPNKLFLSVTCIAPVSFHGMGLPKTVGLCSSRHVEIYPNPPHPQAVFIERKETSRASLGAS